jgi:hypothetical protein
LQLIIENTKKIVRLALNGVDVPVRIWEGRTAGGIPVHCFIARVAVNDDQDCSQFDRELQEYRAPSAEVAAIPLRSTL